MIVRSFVLILALAFVPSVLQVQAAPVSGVLPQWMQRQIAPDQLTIQELGRKCQGAVEAWLAGDDPHHIYRHHDLTTGRWENITRQQVVDEYVRSCIKQGMQNK